MKKELRTVRQFGLFLGEVKTFSITPQNIIRQLLFLCAWHCRWYCHSLLQKCCLRCLPSWLVLSTHTQLGNLGMIYTNYINSQLLAACTTIDHCDRLVCNSGTDQQCRKCEQDYGADKKAYRLVSNNRVCESKCGGYMLLFSEHWHCVLAKGMWRM